MDADHPFEILQTYSLVTAPLEGLALGWSEPVRICYSARHTALESGSSEVLPLPNHEIARFRGLEREVMPMMASHGVLPRSGHDVNYRARTSYR